MPKSPIESQTPSIASPAPWPMTFVWLGDHWARDWLQFWAGAARIDNPAQSAEAEGAAIFNLARDWTVAMGALWTLPVSAWLAARSPSADDRR